jgi:tellurite methyltransferase
VIKIIIQSQDKPSQFLVNNIDLLPKGRALDIAMGNGRNAVFLASLGFQVDGIDISEESLKEANEFAACSNVKINNRVADLEKGHHIEGDAYDLIICFNYLQRSLFQEIKKGIRVGGVIVYETYIVDQARFGRPSNPYHLLKHNELLNMFRDFRCLRYHEGIFEEQKAVAGIIAEKLKN